MKYLSEHKDIKNKFFVIRVDYNIPNEKSTYRIQTSKETIDYIINNGGKVLLITHYGRPKGKDQKLSLKKIVGLIEKVLGRNICFIESLEKLKIIKEKKYDLYLLENIRFWKEEEENSLEMAQKIKGFFDYYVNEAFSVSHRKHMSVHALPQLFGKEKSMIGFWFEKELYNLQRLFEPEDPFIAVLGGAKIKTKEPVIRKLLYKADKILIGGMLLYPFLSARNKNTGKWKDEEATILARKIDNEKIILPIDFKDENGEIVKEINNLALDIGPETLKKYFEILKNAKTIFWNGPLGKYEEEGFDSTRKFVRWLADQNSFRFIGGGDSLVIVEEEGLINKFDFVSTGGGATLHFISNNKMPALEVMGFY